MASRGSTRDRSGPRAARAGLSRPLHDLVTTARRERLVVLAGVLFVAIFVLRVATARPGDAILVLCVVPIVLCAIARGPVGGATASVVALALTALWGWHVDADVSGLGYAARAVSFAVVSMIVGHYAAQRRSLATPPRARLRAGGRPAVHRHLRRPLHPRQPRRLQTARLRRKRADRSTLPRARPSPTILKRPPARRRGSPPTPATPSTSRTATAPTTARIAGWRGLRPLSRPTG